MKNEVKEALNEELLREIRRVKHMGAGTDDESKAVANIAKLLAQVNDAEKIDNEVVFKADDTDLKLNQLEFERDKFKAESERLKAEAEVSKKQGRIKLVIDGAAVIIPAGLYLWLCSKGFKFEESGTFTSTTFRNLINKIKPSRR